MPLGRFGGIIDGTSATSPASSCIVFPGFCKLEAGDSHGSSGVAVREGPRSIAAVASIFLGDAMASPGVTIFLASGFCRLEAGGSFTA